MTDPDVQQAFAHDVDTQPSEHAHDTDAPDFEPSVFTGAGAIAIGLWLLSRLLAYLHIRLV